METIVDDTDSTNKNKRSKTNTTNVARLADNNEKNYTPQKKLRGKKRSYAIHKRSSRAFKTSSQLKRLVVPQSLQELRELDNIYECHDSWLMELGVWKRRRPLPSMTSLATQPQQSGEKQQHQQYPFERRGLQMPLLQSFVSKLRAEQGAPQATPMDDDKEQDKGNDTSSTTKLIPMEDPSLSTLTKGQHCRYLQLLQERNDASTKKWNETKQKEFQKLLKAVKREQELYRQVLAGYMEGHLNVYRVGFGPSHTTTTISGTLSRFSSRVALFHSKQVEHYKEQWETHYAYVHYGKCTQTISVQTDKAPTTHATSRVTQLESLILNNQIVQKDESYLPTDLPWECFQMDSPVSFDKILNGSGTTALWTEQSCWPALIRDDKVALDLARRYKASVITTRETLQTLLQLPSSSTSWMIPVSIQEGLVWMDVPVPQPCNPRQCLTRGYEIVLKQALLSMATGAKEIATTHQTQYVYTLLTLGAPRGTPRQGKTKVLVRSANHVALEQSNNNNTPVCLHAQLDYFDGKQEEFTSHQKALWILDKILQPSCRVMVGRIFPFTAQLLSWEETTHALVQQQDQQEDDDDYAMNHIQAMVQLLHSMTKMERDWDQLLCWPGRGASATTSSVSVHKKETGTSNISIEKELEQAKLVFTSDAALTCCIQPFQWQDPDRIPFTFPI